LPGTSFFKATCGSHKLNIPSVYAITPYILYQIILDTQYIPIIKLFYNFKLFDAVAR